MLLLSVLSYITFTITAVLYRKREKQKLKDIGKKGKERENHNKWKQEVGKSMPKTRFELWSCRVLTWLTTLATVTMQQRHDKPFRTGEISLTDWKAGSVLRLVVS